MIEVNNMYECKRYLKIVDHLAIFIYNIEYYLFNDIKFLIIEIYEYKY